ncbi:MAG: UDP-3-O-acyl-N-acetylglucosamine deacetylase [Selenomonadaceae bacterium]|nr:UDP-3-O-acyl-N-acetylglucosamine deacetylase [Selenomonadaceae bacterium]
MQKETTLAKPVFYQGVGLHSGKNVHIEFRPAPAGTGIVLLRTDLPGTPEIHAVAENVTSTLRATTVEENGNKVFTIEHMMSALHALRIDNCYIALDAEEPPVADGSSLTYFRLLRSAGKAEQDRERREIVIDKVYRIDDEKTGRFVLVLPYDGFRVSFTSVNPHKLIGIQYEDFLVDEAVYEKEIAPARTIAYEGEIRQLRAMGLGLGGTMENVIVYNDDGWLNPLHFDDELVRHKILDVIGDLRLAGMIRGHVIAAASGHALNTQLAKKIAAAYRG